jgi:diguanylate cyclase (GGDEF)-like protein
MSSRKQDLPTFEELIEIVGMLDAQADYATTVQQIVVHLSERLGSSIKLIPPDQVRSYFESRRQHHEALRAYTFFEDESAHYIPLRNGQIRNLGILALEKNEGDSHIDTLAKGTLLRQLSPQISYALAKSSIYDEARQLAHYDGLTGLLNRRRFEEVFSAAGEYAKNNHSPLSLLLLDVDNFGLYNNTFGHPQGDEALKTVAQVLKSVVSRSGDKTIRRPRKESARYGGEEFLLLLPETPVDGAYIVGERAREKIHEVHVPIEKVERKTPERTYPLSPDRLTFSMGIASYPEHTQDPLQLLQLADNALYKAKQNGKDRVVVYTKN